MKKVLSFVWPQTRKITTDFNGVLELTWINGRKVLDSKNANYSYGALQLILEEGMSKIDLKKVNSILLLGLGGGSMIASLKNKFNYQERLDIVELDQKVIAIAEQEFDILNFENLTVINHDAYDFVQQTTEYYDLIVVDLFIDQDVPAQFLTNVFCENLSNRLNEKGAVLYNLGINLDKEDQPYQVINYFEKNPRYRATVLERVNGTNTLVIAQKNHVE